MPQNVYIENMETGAENTYIFTDVRDTHFTKADPKKVYQRTKKVVLKNCPDDLKICENKDGICGMETEIPVERL